MEDNKTRNAPPSAGQTPDEPHDEAQFSQWQDQGQDQGQRQIYEQYEVQFGPPPHLQPQQPQQQGPMGGGGPSAPQRPGNDTGQQKGMRNMAERRIRVSAIVAGILVLAIGGLIAVIVASYPGNDGSDTVPVVKADKVAFKEKPAQPGGMEIANKDSTVYETFRPGESEREVENLLRESGQPMDKLEAFAKQVEEKLKEQEMEREARIAAMEQEQESATPDESKLLQQISPASGDEAPAEAQAVKPASKPQAANKAMHEPGQSPDTIEFVRSVLEKKKAQQQQGQEQANAADAASDAEADQAASVEPAAGAATSAGTYTSGVYFVQLASIGERARAPGQWDKLVSTYPDLLQDVKYRVMKAELSKGTFYRIQAGPFSKNDANKICNAIKAQKPGGCFVIK